jgi:hypothetical protein
MNIVLTCSKKFFTPHLYPARLMLAARMPGVNFAHAKLTPCGRNYAKKRSTSLKI